MKIARTLLSLAVLWALALAAASAAPPPEYSVTVIATNGTATKTAKRYVSHGKTRTEMEQGGQTVVSIVRPDKKVTWTVLMAPRMYSEIPITGVLPPADGALPDDASYSIEGTETIDGVQATKLSISLKGQHVGFVWMAGSTPLRFKSADGVTTADYKDFKMGPQPAALFELPAGFKKMTVQKQP